MGEVEFRVVIWKEGFRFVSMNLRNSSLYSGPLKTSVVSFSFILKASKIVVLSEQELPLSNTTSLTVEPEFLFPQKLFIFSIVANWRYSLNLIL